MKLHAATSLREIGSEQMLKTFQRWWKPEGCGHEREGPEATLWSRTGVRNKTQQRPSSLKRPSAVSGGLRTASERKRRSLKRPVNSRPGREGRELETVKRGQDGMA